MESSTSISSVVQLLDFPDVRRARFLELFICDAVHFRLLRPDEVFTLIELRLLQRDAETFKGFARIRREIESAIRSAPIEEKIAACCVRQPLWNDYRQVLNSTELEVWMDLSYPVPWVLDLYQQALARDQFILIPNVGPFPKLFNKLLLQKNGFERVVDSADPAATIPINLGPPQSRQAGRLNLVPPVPDQRPHTLSEGTSLSEQLANGVIIKDREEQIFRKPAPADRYMHDIGFRLLGPTLVLLFQGLASFKEPVAFAGIGSGFLTTLGQSLQHAWPWLPEITTSGRARHTCSLFPHPEAEMHLLPEPTKADSAVIPLAECDPGYLLLPPMEAFFLAAMKGPLAPQLQASTSSFIRQYAQVTRGLFLPLPLARVLRHWRQQILSPKREFLEACSREGLLADFRRPFFPWVTQRLVKSGPWPTGSYLLSGGVARWWTSWAAPRRSKAIESWRNELAQSASKPGPSA